MYLFILLLVPALSNGESQPSYGVNLPHGSITFYGPDFGDNRRIELPEFESSTRSYPTFVTSFKPSFALNYGQWTPITSTPSTFFKTYVSTTSKPRVHAKSPPFFSLSYPTPTEPVKPRISPPLTSFTQGPVNSAVPITLFYPEIQTTKSTIFRSTTSSPPPTTTTIPTKSSTKQSKITTEQDYLTQRSSSQLKLNFDFSTLHKLDDDDEKTFSTIDDEGSSKNSQDNTNEPKTTLEDGYSTETWRKELVNDISLYPDSRIPRKVDFSSPSGKNITALIQKALRLVKKVEEIDERKRTLQSALKTVKNKKSSSSSRSKEEDNIENLREELRTLKEDKKIDNLKSFIQDQSSIASLIKSETSDIKDILQVTSRKRDREVKETKSTKEMINALARLNSISSLLLQENDRTKSTVRQLPDEIRGIVQDEIVSVKELLEDQNIAVASALRSAIIRQEDREERKIEGNTETDVVVLKALAKLNNIAGILLREQEKTEKQTSSALKALPALAKFIQAETSDIKDLIEDNEEDIARNEDLEELKDAVSQSLANDKLITRAIIKLNDITQLLLRDVNFTTSAVTNKLPEALTALITHETGKIRKMIDLQNDAIVDILKESDNLARAEKVIQEAQRIKKNLLGANVLGIEEEKPIRESDKLLELIGPFLDDDQDKETVSKSSRADKLVEILGPLLKKDRNVEESLEEEVKEIDNETEDVLKAQLAGQKSIVKALLKLTNITRTLLDERDNSNHTPEEIRSSGNISGKNSLRIDEEESSGSTDYEEYYDKPIQNPKAKKRPQSLVETIAGSPGNRALRGNQALFEEFVKLAIERQRWEQAQDVTRIIQSTLPKADSDYYYDYPEYGTKRRPNQRLRNPFRNKFNRPRFEDYYSDEVGVDENENNSGGHLRSDRPFKRPRFEDNDTGEEEQKESPRSSKPFHRQSKFPKRPFRNNEKESEEIEKDHSRPFEGVRDNPPRRFRPGLRLKFQKSTQPPQTTTTTEPLIEYESYYYDEEEYLDFVDKENLYDYPQLKEEPLSIELIDQKEVNIKPEIGPQLPSRPSLNTLTKQRSQSTRRPLFQPRGRLQKPRLITSNKPKEDTDHSAFLRSNIPESERREKEPEKAQPTEPFSKPRFRPTTTNQRGTRLNFRNSLSGKKENLSARLIEPTSDAIVPIETTTSIVILKNAEKESERRREDLLQKLLNHARGEGPKETSLDKKQVKALRKSGTRDILEDKSKESKENLLEKIKPLNTVKVPEDEETELIENVPRIVATTSTEVTPSTETLSTENFRLEPKIVPTSPENIVRVSASIEDNSRRKRPTDATTEKAADFESTTRRNVRPVFTGRKKSSNRPTTSQGDVSISSTFRPTRIRPFVRSPNTETDPGPQVVSVRPVFTASTTSSPVPVKPETGPHQRNNSRKLPGGKSRGDNQNVKHPRADQQRGLEDISVAEFIDTPDTKPLSQTNTIQPSPRPGRTKSRPSFRGGRKPSNEVGGKQNSNNVGNSRTNPQSRNNPFTRASLKTSPAPKNKNNEEDVLPLTDNERESKKQERNNLFKKLLRGRSDETTSAPLPTPAPAPAGPQNKKMSPLENLFNIIKTSKEDSEPVVRVTSSSSTSSRSSSSRSSTSVSSSSSSSSISSSIPSASNGGKRKKVKKSVAGHTRTKATESPDLQRLTPQQRLVKKVQETLRNENRNQEEEARDIIRQTNPRKKVIFRKRKDGEVRQAELPREGRKFQPGSSQIKSVKVRVRRIEEIPPFPIVY